MNEAPAVLSTVIVMTMDQGSRINNDEHYEQLRTQGLSRRNRPHVTLAVRQGVGRTGDSSSQPRDGSKDDWGQGLDGEDPSTGKTRDLTGNPGTH